MRGRPKSRQPHKVLKKAEPGNVGDYIRFSREAMGFNKAELAELLGVKNYGSQFIYRIEKNEQNVPLRMIVPLARILRIPAIQLRVFYAEKEMDRIRERYGITKVPIKYELSPEDDNGS